MTKTWTDGSVSVKQPITSTFGCWKEAMVQPAPLSEWIREHAACLQPGRVHWPSAPHIFRLLMICGAGLAYRFDDFKVWKGSCGQPDGSTERSPAARSLPPTPNSSNARGAPESSSLAAGHGENFTAQNCTPRSAQA